MRRDDERAAGDIEFLAPDSRAFGEAASTDFVGFDDDAAGFDEDPPPSRWLAAIAALVVCGLIAAGVIAASPWSDQAATPPTTTVPVPSTTAPPPPTTADILDGVPVSPSGWVVDDMPDGLEFAGAWSAPGMDYDESALDVWVDRPDDPTAGRWVVVRWDDVADNGLLVRDASRFDIGGHPAMVWTDASGVTSVWATITKLGNGSPSGIDVRANGVDLGALVDLVGRVERTPAGISYGADTPQALVGFTLAWSGPTTAGRTGAFGEPDSQTLLFDPSNGSGLQLHHSRVDPTLLPYMSLLLPEVPLADDAALQMQALGRPVTVYAMGQQDDRSLFATWVQGDQAVTVRSFGLDQSAVLAVLAAARPAEQDEWVRLVERTQRGLPFQETGPSASATLTGTLSDGSRWSSSFAASYFWVSDNASRGWYTSAGVPDGAGVRRYAALDADIVTATAMWPNPARTMRVTVGGAAPVDVPMVQVGDGPIFVAMFVQLEVGPIEVQLLDLDGNVVPPDSGG